MVDYFVFNDVPVAAEKVVESDGYEIYGTYDDCGVEGFSKKDIEEMFDIGRLSKKFPIYFFRGSNKTFFKGGRVEEMPDEDMMDSLYTDGMTLQFIASTEDGKFKLYESIVDIDEDPLSTGVVASLFPDISIDPKSSYYVMDIENKLYHAQNESLLI